MSREKDALIIRAKIAIDVLTLVGAFFLTHYLISSVRSIYKFNLISSERIIVLPRNVGEYLPILLLWVSLWVFMLFLNGIYRSFRTSSFLEIVWIIIKAAFLSALSFGSLAFLLKIRFVSRFFFFSFINISSVLLILEKWGLMRSLHGLRKQGYNFRRLLIVGTGPRAEKFIKMLREKSEWGFKVIGLVDEDPSRVGEKFFDIMVVGTLADIPNILGKKSVDEVIFVVPRNWLHRIQKSIAICETRGVRTSVAADLFDLRIARATQGDLYGFPVITFETTFGQEWQLFVKRCIDMAVSAVALMALSPLLLLVATLIKITSPGPIFFVQRRVTIHGRVFNLFKFRSMLQDARRKQKELEHLNEMDGPVFKIKEDPRITPLGRILRKLSIDELPQLFNVLMGHMSIVGPRPPIPAEVKKYQHWQRRRLSMRSGLTCLWQIRGRNNVDFEEWMELDLEYIDNWSLWLDFKIIVKTFPVVLFGYGAR